MLLGWREQVSGIIPLVGLFAGDVKFYDAASSTLAALYHALRCTWPLHAKKEGIDDTTTLRSIIS